MAGEPDDGRSWFEALYRAELSYVWHSLRRLGVREAELPDLTHEVFVIVYRRRLDYDPSRPLRPWLFGVAFRVAAGHRRLSRVANELPSDTMDQHAGEAAPEEDLLAAERRALVHRALATLDLDQRAVFVLHDIDGVAVPAIAEALDVKLNTVYSRLRLARQKFAAAVRAARDAEEKSA